MTLTVAEVANQGAFRLGYGNSAKLPEQVSVIQLCNQAGHALVRARNWRWLNREGYGLSLVQDVSSIVLPDDFREVISIEDDESVGSRMIPSTMAQVLAARTVTGDPGTWGYFYTVAFPTGAISGPTGPARLEIGPTPAAALTNAFRLNYLAGFKVVSADSDHIYVPLFMEELYVEYFTAFLGGIMQRGKGLLAERLLALEPLVEMAANADATTQRALGRPNNTAEDQVSSRHFSTITMSGAVTYTPP